MLWLRVTKCDTAKWARNTSPILHRREVGVLSSDVAFRYISLCHPKPPDKAEAVQRGRSKGMFRDVFFAFVEYGGWALRAYWMLIERCVGFGVSLDGCLGGKGGPACSDLG
jgi:hypothetical protein